MRPRTLLPALILIALAGAAACTHRDPAASPVPGSGPPVEVARFVDVRGGTGVAAPTAGWFQRQMGRVLERQGFVPRLLGSEELPSGKGLSVTGRLHTLPSTIEVDGPPGEVMFSVEVRRDGKPMFWKNYQDKVWLGWPQMAEPSVADSALREATDRALASFAEDLRKASAGAPSPTS